MIGTIINDRYEIQTVIGHGGMGTVYQAEDIVLERPVAVKVVLASALGLEGQARLLQEARAAARLNHPNIVTVYDAGQVDLAGQYGQSSYIVMELVQGTTLRDAKPQNVDRIIDISIKICQALIAAHEQGVIHRDLKPENIMITNSEAVKLMDFGLARVSGKTRLTQEGTLMGTLSYLAPEIILGQDAEVRSDLYALGVMLYEMCAVRSPFEADSLTAVISQHLHAPIVPPSTYNDRIPPALDQLIIQLLGKRPGDRPQSADTVLAALEAIGKAGSVHQMRVPVPQLNRLVRGRMVGREAEFAEAVILWQEAAAGKGQLLLVSGEPGIGKTRLVHELIAHVRVSGGRVLSSASYAEGGAPYAPFRQILRESLGRGQQEFPDDLLADLLTLTPELRSSYADLPDRRIPGDPQEEQQRLLDDVSQYFRLLGRAAPLLVVLEDMHWADSGTVALMRHLVRSCQGTPMMIVATYREVEIGQARPLHRAVHDLQREQLVARIKLSRLDRAGTQDLLATLFDDAITPEFLDSIYREAEGNPFFTEEISKALVESGQLTFRNGRWDRPEIEELGIPQSIRVAIQVRASALSPESQEILEQAAVLGRAFDLPTLQLSTGLDEDALIDALEEATIAQLIEEEAGDEERFLFVHALIPASLTAGLRSLRRRRMQRRAVKALEIVHPEEYEILAHHFIEAGQIDRGAFYLLLAGDRARIQYAHEEATESYRAAIEYLKEEGQWEQAARALMKLGLTYNNAFDFNLSRQAYQEGFALWQQTSLSPSAESAQPAPHPLRLLVIEPTSLDQAVTNDTASGLFIDQLFSGLIQLTHEMDVVPDVAHSWEVLDAGRRYRFYLRDDVFWSDGVQVTAVDFAFACQRILAPEHNSQNAPQFFMIQNARDFYESRLSEWEAVGIKVIDPLTLEFTLESPNSTFLLLISQFAYAMPHHRLQGPNEPLMDWDELVTNGPFTLTEWEPGQRLRLEANPMYHGQRSGNVEAVEINVPGRPGDMEGLELYESDLLDVLVLTLERAVRAGNRYASDYLQYSTLSTSYLGFNTRKAPFADSRMRRALALATDKEHLTTIFLQDLSFPASGGFIPPGMPGHIAGIGLPYNPEGARDLLAGAGYGEKGACPPVEFLMGEDYTNFKINEYLTRQWQEILGLDIELVQLPWSIYLERLQMDPPAIFSMAWTADFPDPDNFLGLSGFIEYSGWHHKVYDQLIRQAREMVDQEGRLALYRQAEEILVEESPIIPFTYDNLSLLVKPWMRRFPVSPIKFWFWKDVVIEPH